MDISTIRSKLGTLPFLFIAHYLLTIAPLKILITTIINYILFYIIDTDVISIPFEVFSAILFSTLIILLSASSAQIIILMILFFTLTKIELASFMLVMMTRMVNLSSSIRYIFVIIYQILIHFRLVSSITIFTAVLCFASPFIFFSPKNATLLSITAASLFRKLNSLGILHFEIVKEDMKAEMVGGENADAQYDIMNIPL